MKLPRDAGAIEKQTLMGPFFRTPTPNRLNSFSFGAKLMPVALSVMAWLLVSSISAEKRTWNSTLIIVVRGCKSIVFGEGVGTSRHHELNRQKLLKARRKPPLHCCS